MDLQTIVVGYSAYENILKDDKRGSNEVQPPSKPIQPRQRDTDVIAQNDAETAYYRHTENGIVSHEVMQDWRTIYIGPDESEAKRIYALESEKAIVLKARTEKREMKRDLILIAVIALFVGAYGWLVFGTLTGK